jgi:hypothetical protein
VDGRGRSQWRRVGSKMRPSKVCRPLDADSHYFDEEQDMDPDQYISEKSKPNFSEKMDPESGSALK